MGRNKGKAIILFCLAALCVGYAAFGTREDVREDPAARLETESVPSNENQRQAKTPTVGHKTLGRPEPERISVGKYAYESLPDEVQLVYDEMLSAILSHTAKITLSTMDMGAMRRAYAAVCSDYGGLFWVDGYVFTKYTKGGELVSLEFAPKYTMTKEEREDTQTEIDAVVEEWLSGISVNDTDYDKAKYVYELLADNTEYVQGAADCQNIISVFLKRRTVCQGYACAVQYLMGQLGVRGAIVTGTALGQAHAWNLLCLDGEYYYMDATWGNAGYKSSEGEEKPFTDYNYMTMTTAEMQKGHIPGPDLELPECTATEDNYFVREGYEIVGWEPDRIGALLAEAWQQGRAITLRFLDGQMQERAFRYFIEEGHVSDYCAGIQEINYMVDDEWKEISFCFSAP